MKTHKKIKSQSIEGALYGIENFFRGTFVSRWISDTRKAGWQKFYEGTREKASVYHINDCSDDNAKLRLQARSSELVGRQEGFAEARSDLEASGHLVDLLHSLDNAVTPKKRKHTNVIFVNVAPRNGEAKTKHENGTPFCYFRYKGTLVIATVDGYTLSLLKKFGIVDSVTVLDTRKTLSVLKRSGQISPEDDQDIGNTQFRSMEFSPRVASYLLRKGELPGTVVQKDAIKNAPCAVWTIDKFGNCKTTITADELKIEPDGTVKTLFGNIRFYAGLKDIKKDGERGIIIGSSGYGRKKFVEIVVQGGSAKEKLGISIGDQIV